MKVLVLTATIGQGHNAVAHSIQKGFKRHSVPCEVLDMYGYVSPALKKLVSQGYLLSVNSVVHMKKIGQLYYESMEKNYKSDDSFSRMANATIAKEIRKFIDAYQPDVILCTQVYCAHVLCYMQEQKWIDTLTLGVLTDFTVQAHWEGAWRLNYIVTATEQLNPQLVPKGFPEPKILPFGIPISPKFGERKDKAVAREMLQLDPNLPTLLIMGGSMGYGGMDRGLQQLDKLPEEFQAIVVCGRNYRMRNRLRELKLSKRYDIYGYTSSVSLMMDAADLIVTKPGGISMSESLAKRLPMVLSGAIPGMEDYNAAFMEEHGLASVVTKKYPLAEAVHDLLDSSSKQKAVRKAMAPFSHPDSTDRLCRFILEEVEKRSSVLTASSLVK